MEKTQNLIDWLLMVALLGSIYCAAAMIASLTVI
jgi:hypothetical protein